MDWTGVALGAAMLGLAASEWRWQFSSHLTRRPLSSSYYRFRRGASLVTLVLVGLALLIAGLLG